MKYDLSIRSHNIEPHLDIESEISKKKNGLFTCVVRVNNSNIVDVVVNEYVTAKEYLRIKSIVITELTASHYIRERSVPNAVGNLNPERRIEGWGSTDNNTQHSQIKTEKI